MSIASAPSPAHRSGTVRTFPWLLLFILIGSTLLPALPVFAGPGSGWVKADVVSGGCVQQGGVTVCSSEVTPGSPTLYEYTPWRQSAGRVYSESPNLATTGFDTHGYGTVYESRDKCVVNGVFMYWPAGTWHHGARWTLQIINGSQVWSGPSNRHWVFEHKDSCRPEGPNATPTDPPGGGVINGTPVSNPPPTLSPPPGNDPTPIPTVTQGICADNEILPFGPMPLDLWALPSSGGSTLVESTSRRAIRTEMHGGMNAPAIPPAPYTMVAAGTELFAVFRAGATSMIAPGSRLIDYGLMGDGSSRPNGWQPSDNREWVVALQDLGADGALGGTGANADVLLLWLAGGVGRISNSYYSRVLTQWIWPDYFAPGNPGWRAGWGLGGNAVNASSTMYESRTGGTYGQRASTPSFGGDERWWFVNAGDGNYVGARFIAQPDRVYRMVSTVGRPACTAWYYSSSQLVISTYPAVQPNLSLTKSAPATALRGESFDYTLFYRNGSGATTNGAVITDDLPIGVTYVSATPAPASISGRRLTWNLGNVASGASGTITVRVTVAGNAPATLTNLADLTATNDSNASDNHSEAITSVPQGNVTVSATAPRTVEPSQTIDLMLTYRNTTAYPVRFTMLKDLLPPGVTFISSSRAVTLNEDAGGGQRRLTWDLGTVVANASATITLRIRVEDAAPNVLRNVLWIESPEDANTLDNEAETSTIVLRAPDPQATFKLRIHSDLDPANGVYLTSGSAFRWPAGEVLDFAPAITLTPPQQPPEGFYTITQQVVAWSFVRSGGLQPNGASCKARTTPLGSETANADLSGIQGCVYRYLPTPTANDMAGLGHLYWANSPPDRMRSDVYVLTPLPAGPTDLVIQIAVLTTVQENGSYDVNGDGVANSVLLYRTHLVSGSFTPTLLVPRDAR